jgi:4-amino-4-deoxy-L-arabinose transferase-like glycosyltransferase
VAFLRNTKSTLLLILLGSVLARCAAALYLGNTVVPLPGTTDQLSYHTLALRLLGGHGFTFGEPWWPATLANEPTAHWSFLYTFYLAGVYALTGSSPLVARLIQAVLTGLLQPWLAYLLGRKVFDERVGLVGAALTAGYAYFIYYAAALMTEAFYLVAVLASLYLALRLVEPGAGTARGRLSWRLATGLGLAAGAAVLLRQVFLLMLPLVWLWAAWAAARQGRGTLRGALGRLTLAGGLIVALILPFSVFNTLRFGRFVLLNTNAGFAFYWANHPVYGTQFDPIISEDAVNYLTLLPDDLRGLNEAELDSALLARGLGFVAADPARYLALSLSRIPSFFMFWPSSESSTLSNLARMASFGLLWPFMLYGLILAGVEAVSGRRPGLPVALLAGFALAYTLIHLLVWTLVRYRLPVDAVLVVLAAAALADLAARLGALVRPRPLRGLPR